MQNIFTHTRKWLRSQLRVNLWNNDAIMNFVEFLSYIEILTFMNGAILQYCREKIWLHENKKNYSYSRNVSL